jgi:hypothetical protein
MADTFDKNIRKILFPVLKELGFQRVKLKGIMCSEYLFNNGDVWFSLSWDWRDQYLDVSLGKLFWFKDVMERVVVIGDYSNYDERITYSAMSSLGSDVAIFEAIAESLKDALKMYKEKYQEIFRDFRVSRSARGGINIDEYIGAEVGLADLQKFKA